MAAADLRFSVTGLRESEQAIAELGNEYGPRNARRAFNTPISRALAPVRDAIYNGTPVDTGVLQSSTRTMVGSPNRFDQARAGGQSVLVGRTGWFWPTSNSRWFQALAVEFGTSQTPARGVIRGAFSRNAQTVLNIFSQELASNIIRTANRLEQRYLRQGTAFRRR